MIRMLGGLVGCQAQAEALADGSAAGLERSARRPRAFPRRLRVFFEEWDDPLISGIRWVEELVEIAGGAPIFPELADARLAKDRIVDPPEVARRDPQVVFASWCGKKMRKATIRRGRDGTRSARCATIASSRSSRPTSCSPVRPASPKASASFIRFCNGCHASDSRKRCTSAGGSCRCSAWSALEFRALGKRARHPPRQARAVLAVRDDHGQDGTQRGGADDRSQYLCVRQTPVIAMTIPSPTVA